MANNNLTILESKTDESPQMSGFRILRVQSRTIIDIELTQQELDQAYFFEEQKIYYADIVSSLSDMEGDDEMRGHAADEIIDNEALMEKIVSAYTKNRGNYLEWFDAAQAAIEQEIKNAELIGLLSCVSPVSV